MNELMIYLTAIGCKPGDSVTRLQTEITYKNNNQHQQYIEQTIYPTLGGSQDAERAPSLRGIPQHLPYNRGKARKTSVRVAVHAKHITYIKFQ